MCQGSWLFAEVYFNICEDIGLLPSVARLKKGRDDVLWPPAQVYQLHMIGRLLHYLPWEK